MADEALMDDGHPCRESGDWIVRKHFYLRRYCDIFTKGMRRKWDQLSYIDPMAGPGRCVIHGTGKLRLGSPLVALDADFDSFAFCERDPIMAAALRHRIQSHSKAARCTVHQGDWISWLESPSFALPSGLALAFIDPTGISQIPWSAVSKLAQSSRHIDLLMTIQHGMSITMNAHQFIPTKDETALDLFVGNKNWREHLPKSSTLAQAVFTEYMAQMRRLGFQTREWKQVRSNTNTPLYYICLFSRHPRAMDFWTKIVVKDERGQGSLLLED